MEKENKIICKQVSSMLSLYIDNKISFNERIQIKEHLTNCPDCRKKYMYLKSLIQNLQESYKQVMELSARKQKQKNFSIREHQKFMSQISPYVDNELTGDENFEFRKYLMKSKTAQKELKNTYIVQKHLKYAYNNICKKTPQEISCNVIKQLTEPKNIFDSVILQQIFTMKTAKIAILAGLIFICGYEFKQYDTPLKQSTEHKTEQITGSVSKPFAGDYPEYKYEFDTMGNEQNDIAAEQR